MPRITLAAYNILRMSKLFDGETIAPPERAEAIAKVIRRSQPHVLGLCEAPPDEQHHRRFLQHYLEDLGYHVVCGMVRHELNLAFWVRDPVEVESCDDAFDLYDSWQEDVDGDGVDESFRWKQRPLEVLLRIGPAGHRLRIVLVHAASKGFFDVVNLAEFHRRALGRRKTLLAQARFLRRRVEQLMADGVPVILMGDFNDGPGLDSFEQALGNSFVETLMGSVFEPAAILHHAHGWMLREDEQRAHLWTSHYSDPVVSHPSKWKHRIWIDHILLTPDLCQNDGPLRLVPQSGRIDAKDAIARRASDHFLVRCDLEVES